MTRLSGGHNRTVARAGFLSLQNAAFKMMKKWIKNWLVKLYLRRSNLSYASLPEFNGLSGGQNTVDFASLCFRPNPLKFQPVL